MRPLSERPHAITFTEPTLTQQHQRDEVDVNNIMKRYVKSGVIDHVNKNEPFYGEVPACQYHEAVEQIKLADDMFSELPSPIRKHFDNDPAQFLAFVQDPRNKDDLYTMGLASSPVQTSGPEKPPEKHASASTETSVSAAVKDVKPPDDA